MSNYTQEFPGVYYSDAKWGDLDNDGDLDFIVAGKVSSNEVITSVYINNQDSFSLNLSELPTFSYSAIALSDYDGDDDLDILICGLNNGNYLTKLFINDSLTFNDSGNRSS